MKLLRGDEVIVTVGKDKGKMGKIEKVLVKADKIVVPGMNEAKRHMKAKTQMQKSEVITLTRPFAASKVALMCPKCHKPTRVGYKMEKDKKIRFCRKCKVTV